MNFCESGIIVCSVGVYWYAGCKFAKVESHKIILDSQVTKMKTWQTDTLRYPCSEECTEHPLKVHS